MQTLESRAINKLLEECNSSEMNTCLSDQGPSFMYFKLKLWTSQKSCNKVQCNSQLIQIYDMVHDKDSKDYNMVH